MKKIFAVFTLILVFLLNNATSFASTDWKKPMMGFSGSKARIIQTSYYDSRGQKSHIYALHFKLKKDWKLYGKESNGVGISPSLDFINSSNVTNHNIYWPKSKIFSQEIGDEVFEFDTYEDEVVIPFDLYGDIKNGSVLNFDLTYGVCNKICVPVTNSFSFKVNHIIKEDSFALIKAYLGDFDINLTKNTISDLADNDKSFKAKTPKITLIYALFAAFVGGLILNIMPCVLPVLSIKLISILKNRDFNVATVRSSFLFTAFGILFSFLTFGAIASAVSYSGEVFNWGLQFQNPYFLTFLIAVFVIFIANILGYFNISGPSGASNYINQKIETGLVRKKIFAANFFSGILAVLLATPCSAPFLGAAISFSVTQSAFFTFMVFAVMGVGFAMPYLILIFFPKLIDLFPKSGAWTRIIKNILASFVFLTAIWLCYVLYNNAGKDVALTVVLLSLALFFSFKIKYKLIKTIATLSLILSIFYAPSGFNAKSVDKKSSVNQENLVWSDFERMEIDNYVTMGKTVIIDVTADWCLTCKFNQYRVFENKEVVDLLKSENVIAMRADITKPDKVVMDFVNSYGRYAIPFNIVFGPNAKDGILMSELLNKEDFIGAIKKASKLSPSQK